MWRGKRKAVTFSYDDGIYQDIQLVELFNKYHVKATFNLNSGIQTNAFSWENKGHRIHHMNIEGLEKLYQGHEVAAHGLSHANLAELDEKTIYNEVYWDKKNLENMFQREIRGMAYPFGTYNETVIDVLNRCHIQYARTVKRSGDFALPQNLLMLNPTCHHDDADVFELIEQFLEDKGESSILFYMWGHSYEFDINNNWERMEKILKRLSGKEDIFYGTNTEVLL